MVPNVTVNMNTIYVNGDMVTLTLSWGEPCNNFDPIVNYTVSCSGAVTCPVPFTTSARSYVITNLISDIQYAFSVVATNSVGSGEAGVEMITTPSGNYNTMSLYTKYFDPTVWPYIIPILLSTV